MVDFQTWGVAMAERRNSASWRWANACLVKVQVSAFRNASWWHAFEVLRELLYDLLEQQALRRYGRVDHDVVLRAVAITLDGVLSCRTYCISPAILRLTLLQAYRCVHRPRLPDPESSARPTWYLALANLIDLSKRSWTYIRLAASRGTDHGWKGRLADLCFGPGHNSVVSKALGARKRVEKELLWRYLDLGPAKESRDPIERALWSFNQLDLSLQSEGDISASGMTLAGRILDELIRNRPSEGYAQLEACDCREEESEHALAMAFDAVASRLGQLRETAELAESELARETRQPESVLPHAQRLLEILRQLPPDHRSLEREPEHVVEAISRLPVRAGPVDCGKNGQDAPEQVLHEQLVDRLSAQVRRHGPVWCILWSLALCYDFDSIRHSLGDWLPEAGAMLSGREEWEDRIARARNVALEWKEMISADAGVSYSPFASLEVPAELWERPGPIQQTVQALNRMLAASNRATFRWADLESQCQSVVCAALFSVLMEELATER